MKIVFAMCRHLTYQDMLPIIHAISKFSCKNVNCFTSALIYYQHMYGQECDNEISVFEHVVLLSVISNHV